MIKNQDEISELLFRLLDNEISDKDFLKLKNHFSSDPQAKQHYCQFMADYSLLALRATTAVNQDDKESLQNNTFEDDLWTQLFEMEKNAPVIERPDTEEKHEEVKVVQTKKKTNKISLLRQCLCLLVFYSPILYTLLPVSTYRLVPPE